MKVKIVMWLKTALKKWKQKSIDSIIQLEKLPLLQLIIIACSTNLILEILSRRSVIKGLFAIVENPLMFTYNVLIVLLTLSMAAFFKRRYFWLLLVTIGWMLLGIINFYLLSFRTTPLTIIDFQILSSVYTIIKVYVSFFQLAIILICLSLLVVCIVFAFKKLPKVKVEFRIALISLCATIVLMSSILNISFKLKAVTSDFGNLSEAFYNYGFAYCFTTSIFDSGINKPEDYSSEIVEVVLETIGEKEHFLEEELPVDEDVTIIPGNEKDEQNVTEPIEVDEPLDVLGDFDSIDLDVAPNIIMIQLESFFDVSYLHDFQFSENPIPNFTHLKENYSSGFLTVPVIGAGTVNTEFEVITGMSLDYFGAGEYPYKTILTETTCESICYDLDELGYKNHVIHNHSGTFYSRDEIFPRLGFDSFTSIEYMMDVEYNPIGWAKDSILTNEISKTLKSTQEKDFIYAISVQPHGKYPDTVVDENQEITMLGDIDESDIIAYEYFVNQLHETDAFIGELLQKLSNYQEPTVVVVYGDHLPSLAIEDEDLKNGNKFQTEYVIWSNFPLDNVKKDLFSYQLTAEVLERIGIDNGILTKFHQSNEDSPTYQEELVLLQYDMLYGDRAAYGGINPYAEKEMVMGVEEITITQVEQKGEVIFVKGENFTPFSEVFMDNKLKTTLYVDDTTLLVIDEFLEATTIIFVAQIGDGDVILSQSESISETETVHFDLEDDL